MFVFSFLRAIKFSLQDMARNIWLTLVTVLILVLALFSANLLLSVKVLSAATINAVKNKMDVSLSLNPDSSEDRILALKSKISNLDSVKEVEYISKQTALESFKDKHKNNPEILQALVELGKNPLSPSLAIKPRDINNFQDLMTSLNKLDDDIIESKSRDFEDYQTMLAKINSIAPKASQAVMIISSLFVLITILVVYNAVRVAIYTHQREIGIMKLVGASTWFIRAPYLISGIIYALLGVIIIIPVFYLFLGFIQPYLGSFFSGFEVNILNYYNRNFFLIFGSEFLAAMLVNCLASLVAVGKYSKV